MNYRVFGDAATDPLITLSSKNTPANTLEYVQVKSLDFQSLNAVVETNVVKLPESAFNGSNWSLAAGSLQNILDKLKDSSIPLEKYADSKIEYGIKTGFNEAFFIDQTTRDRLIAEDSKSAEIIKPLVIGDDIDVIISTSGISIFIFHETWYRLDQI